MYQPTQSMPLNSYQVVSPCDNQTDFLAGQVIRFTIPRNVGFFDPHTSRLQMEVSTRNNNYKMAFAQECGVASLIDMVRVSQNGVVLSETTEYSTLNNLFVSYSDSLSIQQRNATQNGARDYVDDALKTQNSSQTTTSGAVLGEILNSDGGANMDRTAKKYQLELRGIGLFELLSVVPSIALGDVLIEIRLVDSNVQALKVHPATSRLQALSTPFATAAATIQIAPPFVGFTCVADSPFVPGMELQALDADGTNPVAGNNTQIQSVEQAVGTGVITITLTGNAGAPNNAKAACVIVSGNDQAAAVAPTTEFVVNKASLLLQVVRPPQQYVESIARKVQEGLMLDLNCYTTYRSSLQANIKNQTIEVPSYVSRARGVLSVPRFQAGRAGGAAAWTINNATDFDIQGQYKNLLSYRTQVGEKYYPNQPVRLDQFLGGQHFSAQHIVELEKALRACSIPMRNLKKTLQNFVVPRCLAKYGSSVNLDKGLRLYLEYDGTTNPNEALDVVTFVNHVNRVVITPMGVEVLS